MSQTGNTILNIVRNDDYTSISTHHLRDGRLKMADKGLLSLLLSGAAGDAITLAELAYFMADGRDALISALRRLSTCGYIRRRQSHRNGGRFGAIEMDVFEIPVLPETVTQDEKIPTTASPFPEKPFTENPETVGKTGSPFPENPETVEEKPDIILNHRSDPTSNRTLGENLRYEENKVEAIDIKEKNTTKKEKPKTHISGLAKKTGTEAIWKADVFARFWKCYPRHESKTDAVRAWNKLRPDDALIRQMSIGLYYSLRSELWRRDIGIPYASTWLNQHRWEDHLPDPAADKNTTMEEDDSRIWTPEDEQA